MQVDPHSPCGDFFEEPGRQCRREHDGCAIALVKQSAPHVRAPMFGQLRCIGQRDAGECKWRPFDPMSSAQRGRAIGRLGFLRIWFPWAASVVRVTSCCVRDSSARFASRAHGFVGVLLGTKRSTAVQQVAPCVDTVAKHPHVQTSAKQHIAGNTICYGGGGHLRQLVYYMGVARESWPQLRQNALLHLA